MKACITLMIYNKQCFNSFPWLSHNTSTWLWLLDKSFTKKKQTKNILIQTDSLMSHLHRSANRLKRTIRSQIRRHITASWQVFIRRLDFMKSRTLYRSPEHEKRFLCFIVICEETRTHTRAPSRATTRDITSARRRIRATLLRNSQPHSLDCRIKVL